METDLPAIAYRDASGANSQIITWQKLVCLARETGRCIWPQPLGSSHDSSFQPWAEGNASSVDHFLRTSAAAANLTCRVKPTGCADVDPIRSFQSYVRSARIAARCVNVSEAWPQYWPSGSCKPSPSYRFPDVLGVTQLVRQYSSALMDRMGLVRSRFVVVQYRFGDDWQVHARRFPGACISFESIQEQVLEALEGEQWRIFLSEHNRTAAPPPSAVLLLKAPLPSRYLPDADPSCTAARPAAAAAHRERRWMQFCHPAGTSTSMQVVSEVYISSLAARVFVNAFSNFQYLIRHFAALHERGALVTPLAPRTAEDKNGWKGCEGGAWRRNSSGAASF